MKVQVDLDVCEGNGVCVRRAPGVFDLGDEGLVVLLDPHPSSDRHAEVRSAVALCPTEALAVVEDDG